MFLQTKDHLFEYFNRGDFGGIPPTPLTGLPSAAEDTIFVNSKIKAEVHRRGMTIITTSEKEGREIHDVIPIEGKTNDYSNEGSGFFPFHVEIPQAKIEDRPDYVMLCCLRGNPEAKTYVIDFSKLVDLLQPAEVELLKQPIFVGQVGSSYGKAEKYLTAVLSSEGDVTMHFGNMNGTDDEAIALFDKMQQLIKSHFKEIVHVFTLKANDYLLFDNKRCLHGRSAFFGTTAFDGSHRWLKRVYLKKAINGQD